ncbi:MAG: zinc ABC transporter substrate-binding protein [Cardiobacteriaceae bacterium]|nr:zinc ABC transporter substrate-binding protein [Cardiobacteriaceae bacterium]
MLRQAAFLGLAFAVHQAVAAPQVVTTIKPLHSLVSQIMDGVGEPVLLIAQGSPHGYQSKPSDAKAIANADMVVWVSSDLETFVAPLLAKSGGNKRQLEWRNISGLHKLKNRSGGLWEEHEHAHEHHEHDHGKHEHHHDHGHEKHGHDHGHAHGKHDHGHDHGHEKHDHDHAHDHGHDKHEHHHEHAHHHHHGEYNDHLWLGSSAAKALLNAVAGELSNLDPENKGKYEANLKQALADLDALNQRIDMKLASVKNRPYMVFHDAYPYFEQDHGLQPVGVVRVDPEHEPGSKRIAELHNIMREHKVICIFNEPQFSSRLTGKLVEGTKVRTGTLDPLGAELKAGKTLHGELLSNLANSLQQCLQDSAP